MSYTEQIIEIASEIKTVAVRIADLEELRARVQELEKDLNGAKRLVSKIWNQHPEAREDIEKGTGVWMVFGQDVETSVSAQRVTQAAHKEITEVH